MTRPRGPLPTILLALALAVNLLAPLAHSSPLFVEICVGSKIVLVPSDDTGEPPVCELCPPASIATPWTPATGTAAPTDTASILYSPASASESLPPARHRPQARAPPPLSV